MPKKVSSKKTKKTVKKPSHPHKSTKIQPGSQQNMFIAIAIAVLALIVIFSVKNFQNSGATNLIAANTKNPCLTCEPKPGEPSAPLPFPDVPSNHQYFTAIKYLKDQGFVKGNPDGTFHPDDKLSRADAMTMVIRALNVQAPTGSNNCFADVKTEWFAPYVCYAKAKGWISGMSPNRFEPGGNITRAAAWKIVLGAFAIKLDSELNPNIENPGPSDVNSAHWFAKYIYTIVNKGWLKEELYEVKPGAWTFKPDTIITRGELANIIYKVLTEAVPSI